MGVAAGPILYSFRRCPFAMRARMALAVSGIRCELREIRLRDKPPSMLEASPKGTVPVLVLPDGQGIDESIDIMRWALSQSDPEGWLERDDAGLIAENDGGFKHSLDRYKYPDRHEADPFEHREQGLAFLRKLEARLSAEGQLCGSRRGLADAAIVPFVRQFAATDADWFDAQALPRLHVWLNGHLASELFATTMIRVGPWSAGDPPVFFPQGALSA
jgi:glutathione S-transferase